jgi:hypothetical protein
MLSFLYVGWFSKVYDPWQVKLQKFFALLARSPKTNRSLIKISHAPSGADWPAVPAIRACGRIPPPKPPAAAEFANR